MSPFFQTEDIDVDFWTPAIGWIFRSLLRWRFASDASARPFFEITDPLLFFFKRSGLSRERADESCEENLPSLLSVIIPSEKTFIPPSFPPKISYPPLWTLDITLMRMFRFILFPHAFFMAHTFPLHSFKRHDPFSLMQIPTIDGVPSRW